MFNDNQIAALKDTLDAKHVKQRAQSGRSLSYIEGWWAIHEANRIFGFDAWSRETIRLEQACEPQKRKIGKGDYQKDGWDVGYIATVRINVWAGDKLIIREGTGFGSGIDASLGSAVESATKEAETDAMKRALMTFGNPFGLALYDKEQKEVEVKPEVMADDHPAMVWASEIMELARQCKTIDQLSELWKLNIDNYKTCAGIDKGLSQEVKTMFNKIKSELSKEAA